MTAMIMNDVTAIEVTCLVCGELKKFTTTTAGYNAWRNGQLIQRAMPDVTADDRELLISAICAKCSDAGRLRMMTEAERNSTVFEPILQEWLDQVKAKAQKNAESFTKRNPN